MLNHDWSIVSGQYASAVDNQWLTTKIRHIYSYMMRTIRATIYKLSELE